MKRRKTHIASVRASRDGHEFHEVWAARRILQLLLPQDNLQAVAIEGLSPSDSAKGSSETDEIADLTLYYGGSEFKNAEKIEVIQFKHSVAKEKQACRAFDFKDTLAKFARAFEDLVELHGVRAVKGKASFQIITNRPTAQETILAIETIAEGSKTASSNSVESQITQLKTQAKLSPVLLRTFCGLLTVNGSTANLRAQKKDLKRVLTTWSTSAIDARSRLGDLRELVRNKAGSVGEKRNDITREDVLVALGLQIEDDLFPCPASFPKVEKVFLREQFDDACRRILDCQLPFVVHAAGGVGKTVFLQSIAARLSETCRVVVFDCFGGGAYRAFNDNRHLPRRGLLHIINDMACSGLCDLMLPGSGEPEDIMQMARRRLSQAVEVVVKDVRGKNLVLVLDAIDNAAIAAETTNSVSFPKLLLESLQYSGSIPNLKVVVSCRSHRSKDAIGQAECEYFELRAFSKSETETFLKSNRPGTTSSEVEVGFTRSGGNARILEHLLATADAFNSSGKVDSEIKLDDLILKRIDQTITDTWKTGYSSEDVNTFLAGLAVLPLPVPASDYGMALGREQSEIESFVSDMAPMLEKTGDGIMFRDEPTETIVKEKFGSQVTSLKRLCGNLLNHQKSSVYAASALPRLLVSVDDVDGLRSLAFSNVYPEAVTSKIGKHVIRNARIEAALSTAITRKDRGDIVRFLVEMSSLASTNERGGSYILNNPDLVVASKDYDSKRRLFELKTTWQGTRHSRLAITYLLSGDNGEAYFHANRAMSWIRHYLDKPDDEKDRVRHLDEMDVSAVLLNLFAQGNYDEAAQCMSVWKPWFGFEVTARVFELIQGCTQLSAQRFELKRIVRTISTTIAGTAAALTSLRLDLNSCRKLLEHLAGLSKVKPRDWDSQFSEFGGRLALTEALIQCAGISIRYGDRRLTTAICSLTSIQRPGLWAFERTYFDDSVSDYLRILCMTKLSNREEIGPLDVLPKEIFSIIPATAVISNKGYRLEISNILKDYYEKERKEESSGGRKISYEERSRSERFITDQLDLLLDICKSFSKGIKHSGAGEKQLKEFFNVWRSLQARTRLTSYHTREFEEDLCLRLLFFSIRISRRVSAYAVGEILKLTDEGRIRYTNNLIALVSIFSRDTNNHPAAGMMAIRASALIENNNDVQSRASNFALLARAIMPASASEMAKYFKTGLDQIDMIGAGDYRFTSELLTFAGSIKGSIEDRDVHTLSNICEMNLDEVSKFPWLEFGNAMANVTDARFLSKISRWDDRDKVRLEYSLLPCLISLVKKGKLKPAYAAALIKLCDPYEGREWDYITLAEQILSMAVDGRNDLMNELISKIEYDDPASATVARINRLIAIVNQSSAPRLDVINWLNSQLIVVNSLNKERRAWETRRRPESLVADRALRRSIANIFRRVDPVDLLQMNNAFGILSTLSGFYLDQSAEAFQRIRPAVSFAQRNDYLRVVCELEGVRLSVKLNEIRACLELWRASSVSTEDVLRSQGGKLLRQHVEEIVEFDLSYLVVNELGELSDLTSVPMEALLIDLVKILIGGRYSMDSAIWMSIASLFSEGLNDQSGKESLVRLLRGDGASLSSSVMDGDYSSGLYGSSNDEEVVANLIWTKLGSPDASFRWRASHSVRSLARLGCWNVVDLLVSKIKNDSGEAFRAPELPFFLLHARLWLLMGLARIAKEFGKELRKHSDTIKLIAFSNDFPHVLMKHYARETLLEILDFEQEDTGLRGLLEGLNQSPFDLAATREFKDRGRYRKDRPADSPEPLPHFTLDYDFDKYHVSPFTDIFGKAEWQVTDSMNAWIRRFDSKVTSMYEVGGRAETRRRVESDDRIDTYGYYLGWHSLLLVAGEYLSNYPIIEDKYISDPWESWLQQFLITRKDGLWLSDGKDRFPTETREHLLEYPNTKRSITGDKHKLLGILGFRKGRPLKDVVVGGSWRSIDDIKVWVGSALVTSKRGEKLAKGLARRQPFHAYLPTLEEYEDGQEFDQSRFNRDKLKDYKPLVVDPTRDAKQDKFDPNATKAAASRLKLNKEALETLNLKMADPFGRSWVNKKDKLVVTAETWGCQSKYKNEVDSGSRLLFSLKGLKTLLMKTNSDLILLVRLERYVEAGRGDVNPSQFWNTTAVVRVDRRLRIRYYKGGINRLLKSNY